MTPPRIVGPRDLHPVLAALAEGRVIVAAGDGGYLLAACHDPGPLPAVSAPVTASRVPPLMVVGQQAQARVLASDWSKETAVLTDRMWPGPLTVMVPASHQASAGAVVHITMPKARPLRVLSRDMEPLVTRPLCRPDGSAVRTPAEIGQWITEADVALVVDGGVCRGPGPTVVDCTASPPVVRYVGALPEMFVEGSLLMGNRRRRWFSGRSGA